MVEHREKYRGVEVLVRASGGSLQEAIARRDRNAVTEVPELHIDGKPVTIRRTAGGAYIAAGYAYAPEQSIVGLAKRIIDHRARSAERSRS
jgi:hypothetical protein